ncbi:MAG: MgtC/SapB family protein, partial [Aquificae bacterium]|nr:MgtC/SapB family protein [Aquificota bacterium]
MEINFNVDKESLNFLIKLAFALVTGLLIGLERERRSKQETFAGIRTFPLISILGTLTAYINDYYWNGIYWIVLGGIILLMLINFYLEYDKDIGATTEIAILISFLLGVLIYYEHYYIAAFLAVITTFLL